MNIFNIMKNAKEIQAKMSEMQSKLPEITETGTAGGDMVSMTMNGKMDVIAVKIDKEVIDPNDAEMLQDLIMAAHNNAQQKIRERLAKEFPMMGNGMGM